jgi:putative transposon-encoded protein
MLIQFELDQEKDYMETKEVKSQKKSGVIYVPIRYIGKKVIIIIKNEDKRTDINDVELS